jgi:hypothetical protein
VIIIDGEDGEQIIIDEDIFDGEDGEIIVIDDGEGDGELDGD